MSQEKEHDTTSGSPPGLESGASFTSLDQDVAIKLVGVHAQEIDPEVESRVLRKIDWFLMPAMIIGLSQVTDCTEG